MPKIYLSNDIFLTEDLSKDSVVGKLLSKFEKNKNVEFLHSQDFNDSQFKNLKKVQFDFSIPNDYLESKFMGFVTNEDKSDVLALEYTDHNQIDYIVSQSDKMFLRADYSSKRHFIFSINAIQSLLNEIFHVTPTTFPQVTEQSVASINLKDPFFDSLKKDYSSDDEFTRWWNKCIEQKRRAWTIYVEDQLAAISIYKDLDHDERSLVPDLGERPFKICTFKVSEHYRGNKFGELLLKPIFQRATNLNSTSLYVTVFEDKHPVLINTLKDFGFMIASKKKGKEAIMYKLMAPPKNVAKQRAFDFYKMFAPYFNDSSDVSKFIVPIQPKYHEELFPEQTLSTEAATTGTHGNTIKKAYLCNTPKKDIPAGSIIFFYRSHDLKAVTMVGIVEEAARYHTSAQVIARVKGRTVFDANQIEEMVNHVNGCTTIVFRLAFTLEEHIPQTYIVSNGILNSSPITVSEIDHKSYLLLKKKSTLLKKYSFNTSQS